MLIRKPSAEVDLSGCHQDNESENSAKRRERKEKKKPMFEREPRFHLSSENPQLGKKKASMPKKQKEEFGSGGFNAKRGG